MHPNDTTIHDYVDGALDAGARAEVDRHLESCGACRLLVDDLREIRSVAGALDLRGPPARAWAPIERAIRLAPSPVRAAQRPGARLPSSRYTSLAAASA